MPSLNITVLLIEAPFGFHAVGGLCPIRRLALEERLQKLQADAGHVHLKEEAPCFAALLAQEPEFAHDVAFLVHLHKKLLS